jgi:hypothetical protein
MPWSKLRTWQSLAPADRACLCRALRLLPAVRVSLRIFGARRTQAWLARTNSSPSLPVGGVPPPRIPSSPTVPCADESRIRQIVRMVRVARRYHRHWTNCLSHSLTLWALLRREGVAAEIRIGARLRRGRLEAHARVEWQGRPLSDPGDDDGDFAVFDRPLIGRSS